LSFEGLWYITARLAGCGRTDRDDASEMTTDMYW